MEKKQEPSNEAFLKRNLKYAMDPYKNETTMPKFGKSFSNEIFRDS